MEICSFLKEIHNFMKFLIRKIQLDAKAPICSQAWILISLLIEM